MLIFRVRSFLRFWRFSLPYILCPHLTETESIFDFRNSLADLEDEIRNTKRRVLIRGVFTAEPRERACFNQSENWTSGRYLPGGTPGKLMLEALLTEAHERQDSVVDKRTATESLVHSIMSFISATCNTSSPKRRFGYRKLAVYLRTAELQVYEECKKLRRNSASKSTGRS